MTDRLGRTGLIVLTLAALTFTLGVMWLRSLSGGSLPAFDIYAYFYPNTLYLWRSIRDGSGVLWNPYQSCGQPFFAMTQNGLLYPPTWLFAVLPREAALLTSLAVHMTILGAGGFLACRALGVGLPAALTGALAFQLGWAGVLLGGWGPTLFAPFVYLPLAMWRTERLIQAPTLRRGLLLSIILTVQMLPGFPQTTFYTYQLVALRIVWALIARETGRPGTLLAAAGVGLALPPLLTAAQLVPSMELARISIRAAVLQPREIGPGFSWSMLAAHASSQLNVRGNLLVIVMAALGLAAPRWLAPWRRIGFYLSVVVVHVVLSVGPGSLLWDLYALLPFAASFRGAARLLQLVAYSCAVLAALGAESLLSVRSDTARQRAVRIAVVAAAALIIHRLTPNGLLRLDALPLLALLAVAAAPRVLRVPRVGPALLPLLIAVNCLVLSGPPYFGLRRGPLYDANRDAFAMLRATMTAQDRVYLAGRYGDFALMPKSASLERLPSVYDYESQVARHYVELFTFMRTGRDMVNLKEWYWLFDKPVPATLRRPLLDLTATRFIVVDAELDSVDTVLRTGVRRVLETPRVRVYENEQALARARYVPRLEVAEGDEGLQRLASGQMDLHRAAIVDPAPRSGFLGSAADATGSAEILVNEAERVVVRVHASAPGFLFLADQFYPGWIAQVNGEARDIMRGNHAFRLVEVPAGESEVVFVYRPRSLALGTAISAIALGVFLVLWHRYPRSDMQRDGTS